MRFFAFFLLALLSFSPQAMAAEENVTLGGRSAVVWAPSDASGKAPLVLFSHGFGGCATQSRFITEALAAHGYWVVAVNHADNRCSDGASGEGLGTGRPAQPFAQPEAWNDATYRDRHDDIVAVLEALKASAHYAPHMDFAHVGLMGHSLGGYTMLGLAGGWGSWKLEGIGAVLALSPYSVPYNVQGSLGGLGVPVMYQGGTRDLGITPFVRKPGGSYDMTHAPKYYVEFEGATHLAWTNIGREGHDTITAYGIAFLDRYLKGDTSAANKAALSTVGSGVSELRYDAEIGTR